jgi:tetratricopeptide (TPR) repeat protein
MSGERRPLPFALAALVVTTATALPARADVSVESESYVQRGIGLRRLGNNREALAAFERAYALDPTPRAGAQIALAEQAMADWVDAEQGLERALRSGGDPWIARYRDALERALETVRAHLGWLDVEANVAHGEFVLDGSSHHDLPSQGPVRVAAGSLEIEVRAPDLVPVRRAIDVAPGTQVHVVVALEPMPPISPSPAGAPTAGQSQPESSHLARVNVHARVGDYAPLAAGAVFAVAGVVAWRVRENDVAIYNDDARCLTGALTREQQCGGRAETANIALGVEIGAFTAAGASAALGVWRLWRSGASSPAIARSPCAPWAGAGVVCEGRF